MEILAANIRLLRKRRRLSQEELASAVGITRSAINSYENKLADPPLPVLVRLAEFFKVSIDRLVRQDLSKLRESELCEIERGIDLDVLGRRLRILTTAIDTNSDTLTELVPEKAKAGYTTGYSDPEFIKELPIIQLPFLSKNRKFRAFTISGDSMPPVGNGDIVIGEYVDDWLNMKSNLPYVLVTRNEGIVFKIVKNLLNESGNFLLISTNVAYSPYYILAEEVLEIWKFRYFISSELATTEPSKEAIAKSLRTIQEDLSSIKRHLHVP
ncbi:hypothetical protein JCM31826_07530 [Thermaurantimonas aggregans]|uniref:HTH cro/C1-type domain-containing protein n=1 Tax=Thermaurantimonas aggregans TaxID=2173829 RepID=A0A401XJX4_9FLAO|nr:LexA family transcriptional regulator [Thermaurantimonas aggregans]MCX8148914.1 LexA family transcriptional regulator [Thermaurantimonas aggregans]GCD77271.1 hypothetical protein JCM31826_07530 [Thermaurantimonas aggregans]